MPLIGPPGLPSFKESLLQPLDVLFIENHDSFSFNIIAALRALGARVKVFTNFFEPLAPYTLTWFWAQDQETHATYRNLTPSLKEPSNNSVKSRNLPRSPGSWPLFWGFGNKTERTHSWKMRFSTPPRSRSFLWAYISSPVCSLSFPVHRSGTVRFSGRCLHCG